MLTCSRPRDDGKPCSNPVDPHDVRMPGGRACAAHLVVDLIEDGDRMRAVIEEMRLAGARDSAELKDSRASVIDLARENARLRQR